MLFVESGITNDTSAPWTPPADGLYRVELYAIRDDLSSWQRYKHNFSVGDGPELDPYGDLVISLLRLNGSLEDETGRAWQQTRGTIDFHASGGPFGGSYARFEGAAFWSPDGLSLGPDEPLTVEAFVRVVSSAPGAGTQCIFALRKSSNERVSFYHALGGTEFRIYQRPAAPPDVPADRTIISIEFPSDEWIHVAYVRDMNGHRLYFSGVQVGESMQPLNGFEDVFLYLGQSGNNTEFLTGDLAELRVTKGMGRYIGNFSPPSGPFPVIG